ncbi:MAG TPA: hypothetical protein VFB62_21520 [Polyangiaceae bacterium]|nr:hypothetical protein [Polyangiaceae bacterium]
MRNAMFLCLALLSCNKSSSPPAAEPDSAPEPAEAPPPEPKPADKPAGTTEESAPDPAKPEGLAHILLDGGVAWLAATNQAVGIEDVQQEGTGNGMQAVIVGDKGKRDVIELCAPTDCDSKKGTLEKKLADELRKRSVSGAVVLKQTEWSASAKELELPGAETKLSWNKNQMQVAHKGKPGKPMTVKVTPPHKAAPIAVYATPDGTVIVVRIDFDPGDKYGPYNQFSELHLYRMP